MGDNDKKDIHNGPRRVEAYEEKIQASSMSERQKKQIINFIQDLKIGKVGKKVKSHRISAYLQNLMKLHKYFNKDLDTISEKEATDFYISLQDNKITRDNGLPFKENSKGEIVKTLKRFLGWAFKGKDNKRYRQTAGWMKEYKSKSDRRAITLEQCDKVISQEKSLRNKAFFKFLFDSGCRIEEALNIRLHDVEIHERTEKAGRKSEYYMINVRFSKTKPRKISLPLTTTLLSQWLKKHPLKADANAFLFVMGYDTARRTIRQMSRKALGFQITPHELRHSSVTYYVQQFGLKDVSGFYYRFGWTFGSKEARTYIDENLIGGEKEQEKLIKTIEYDRVEKLEKENIELKKEMQGLKKDMSLMKKSINRIIETAKSKRII